MSTGGGDKEDAKLAIIRILGTDVQLPLRKDTDESVNPQELLKEFQQHFAEAYQKAENLHKRICQKNNTTEVIRQTLPGIDDEVHKVRRFESGLNRKDPVLTGKAASQYSRTLQNAYQSVDGFNAFVRSHTEVGKAEAELEELKKAETPLKEALDKAEKEFSNLKIPARTSKVKGVTYSVKEMPVNPVTIGFLESTPGKNLAKSKGIEDGLRLEQYRIAAQKSTEYEELKQKVQVARTAWKNASELVLIKQREVNTLETQETERVKQFDNKHSLLRKKIEVIVESGNYFGDDHAPFLDRLQKIKDDAYKFETYEDGVAAINTLELEVNTAKQQVENKVSLKATEVSGQLAGIKDPAGLDGDPVRKKKVDDARALIAKELKDAKLAKPVFDAEKEVPKFKVMVDEVAKELELRPDQTINHDRLKLVYGETLAKIGVKSTGDGAIGYAELNKSKIEGSAVFDVPGRKILLTAGPTTNYKPAEKEVEVVVEKDSPTISWRTPSPILKNVALTTKTLNAKLFDSFKTLLSEALTYVPAAGTSFPAAGSQTVVAKYAGNANRKAATDVSVTIKVMENVGDLGKEAALSGAALQEPTLATHKKIMEKWETDDSPKSLKKQSQKVMNDIQDMTADELKDYMDKFIASGGDGEGGRKVIQGSGDNENQIWCLNNGLQVRYKPQGKVQPPSDVRAPMFCVEAKINNEPNEPSANGDDVVFKLTSNGQPGPYGPAQTNLCDGVPSNLQSGLNKQYMNAACATTHLKCKTKEEQVITWGDPPDLTEGDALGDASLNPTAQDKTALVFTNANGDVLTKATVLPAGAGQVLRVKGKRTLRYLASANFVEVKINVKKVQKVDWKPAKELVAGSKLGTAVLNAKVEDNAVVSYFYFDGTNEQPVDANSELPAGKGLELRARVAKTDLYHAVTEPVVVKIDVNKQVQEVSWEPVKTRFEVGSALGADFLNVVRKDNAVVSYFYSDGTADKPIDASFEPPVGDDLILKASVATTDLYEAVTEPLIVKISVVKKTQEVTWKPIKTVLEEGVELGSEVLNARSSSGAQPAYFNGEAEVSTSSVLPPGEYELRAVAPETEQYDASPAVAVKVVVNKKEESK